MTTAGFPRNENGQIAKVEVFSPSGAKAANVEFDATSRESVVSGLKPGLYLIKASRGSWSKTSKITLR